MKGAGLRSDPLGTFFSMIDPLAGTLSQVRRNLRTTHYAFGSLPKTTRNFGPARMYCPQRTYCICQSQRGYNSRPFVVLAFEHIPEDVIVLEAIEARNAKRALSRYQWSKRNDVEIY